MNKRLKYGIILVVAIQLMLIVAVLVLPPLARALPGELRIRLARIPVGAALLDYGTTPMLMALPAPANTDVNARITIPAIAVEMVTPTIEVTVTAVQSEPVSEIDSIKPTTAANSSQVTPTPTATTTPPPTHTPTPEPLPTQVGLLSGYV